MKRYIKPAVFAIIGAGIGYGWYHFYGCQNGCAITSSWSNMTLLGGLFGFTMGFPAKEISKESSTKEDSSQEDNPKE